jgi:hypothetical protein
MHKDLAVLAVFAVVGFTCVCVSQTPNNTGIAKSDRTSNADKSSAANGKQEQRADKPPVSVTINNQAPSPAENGTKEQSGEDIEVQRQLAKFTKYLVWVGLLQAAVLAGTLALIWRQANLMGEHAGHLENLAVAARANAQAAVASQRPWILVDVEVSKDDPDKFLVYGINKGQTPAEVFDGQSSCKPHNPANFVPPDDIRDPFYSPRQGLTVNGDRFRVHTISRKWMEETLAKSPHQTMFVYGKISYWDTFTDRTKPESEHLTQWCFAYRTQTDDFVPTANGYATNT